MCRSPGPLLIVALCAIGCQSAGAPTDPFLRSRVPPPATGAIGPASPGTYASGTPTGPVGATAPATPGYNGPNSTLTSTPNYNYNQPQNNAAPSYPIPNNPNVTNPPAAPNYQQPPRNPAYAPPGGWGPATYHAPSSSGQGAAQPLSNTIVPDRLTHAATSDRSTASGPGDAALQPPSRLSDPAANNALRDARSTNGIVPTSYTQNSQAANRGTERVSGAGPTDHGATYGYDGNYNWLHGQLEYSAVTRQWKLRYIPINGPTDRYGGSVQLAEGAAMGGFKSGDFISVKGRIDNRTASQGTFSPLYHVSEVQRLSD